MNYASVEDAQLLAIIAGMTGAQSSDPAVNGAISELYDRYSRLVYTIAIHTVVDPETAEEITQDVFIRACAGAHTYHIEIAKVSSWLVSITRHRAFDELRRRGVRADKNPIDWPEDSDPIDINPLLITEGPEETVEMSLQQRCVRQVIAELPPDQRQALALAYFKGFSHTEIANLLGQPLGTVKSRIRIAMQRMRDLLNEQGMIEQ